MADNKLIVLIGLILILFSSLVFAEENTTGDMIPAQGDLSLKNLEEQIKVLNERIQSMQEENAIRRQLETTEEEQYDTEEEVLSAAGRDYTMLKKGLLGFEYSFSYTGNAYNVLIPDPTTIEYASDHSLNNSFNIQYPIKNNLTFSANIPFIYKIDTRSDTSNMYVSDLGDTSLTFQFQPYKSGGELPTVITSLGLGFPTGRSPYKINKDHELSTGTGTYSLTTGLNLSKTVDPLVIFGGLSFNYPFPIDGLHYASSVYDGDKQVWMKGVDPGATVSWSMGVGYSLSYMVSVNINFQYGYNFKTEYKWHNRDSYDSGDSSSASITIGTGWRLSPSRTINVSVSNGLSSNSADYTLTVRVPFEFEI